MKRIKVKFLWNTYRATIRQPDAVYVTVPPMQQTFGSHADIQNRGHPNTTPSAYAETNKTNMPNTAYAETNNTNMPNTAPNTERDLARLQTIQSQIMTQFNIKTAGLVCNVIILVLAVFTLGIAFVCAVGTFAAAIQATNEILKLADEAALIAVANSDVRVQTLNNSIQGRRPSCGAKI